MGKQYLNGVLYGTGEIIKFSPYIYSLEEREVGVWTDGKPLYQKSYYVSNPTKNSTVVIQDASVSNIDNLAKCFGTFDRTISGYVIREVLNSYENTYFYNFVRVIKQSPNTSEIGIAYRITADSSFTISNLYVTIQYTKTTDTPGSGHYTTNGGEAHHYSTEEQVVGTWVDGSTVYEKSISGTTQTNMILLQSVKKIIRVTGEAGGYPLPAQYLDNSRAYIAIQRNNDGNVKMWVSGPGYENLSFDLIVRYTKTS